MSKAAPTPSATKTSVQESDALVAADNYQTVKYNAMTHGILSRHTVLPHEDSNEYNELQALLIQEHQPQGMTEAHLVEELVGTIWRKQRVLLAEGSRINEGMKISVGNPGSVILDSLPFQTEISANDIDLAELLRMSPHEVAGFQKSAQEELNSILKVTQLLESQKKDYKATLGMLSDDDRELWEESVTDEEYAATEEDLLEFFQESLIPWYENQLTVASHHAEIKAQALGEAVQPHQLETLNRYETHLDRKFQRTLAMLIKLKELRDTGRS